MTERPVLFTPENAYKVHVGQKTATRRVIVPQPEKWTTGPIAGCSALWPAVNKGGLVAHKTCPFGLPGDRLWVREAWSVGKPHDARNAAEIWAHLEERKQGVTVLYKGGGAKSVAPFERMEPTYAADEPIPNWAGRPRHARFMPRWACRTVVEITEVRAERLQDINEQDAIAEGVTATPYSKQDIEDIQISDCAPGIKELASILGPGQFTAKANFMMLWDSINAKTYPFSSNPFVWVIVFRKLNAR